MPYQQYHKKKKSRITRPAVRTLPFCTSSEQTVLWFPGHSAFVGTTSQSIDRSASADNLHSIPMMHADSFHAENVRSPVQVTTWNLCFSAKLDALVLTMPKIFLTDWLWLTYVQHIWQPSFVCPFDVVWPRHLPTMPIAYVIIRPWLTN